VLGPERILTLAVEKPCVAACAITGAAMSASSAIAPNSFFFTSFSSSKGLAADIRHVTLGNYAFHHEHSMKRK
jgi:hypothetical protein